LTTTKEINIFDFAEVEMQLTIDQSINHGVKLKNLNVFLENKSNEQAKNGIRVLFRLLEHAIGFFNIREKMTDEQIIQVAMIIMERWPNDNLQDIALALKEAKMGLLKTEIYGRVDGDTIIKWIEEFMDKKAARMEEMHQEQKHARSEPIDFNKMLGEGSPASEEEKAEWIRKCKALVNGNKNKRIQNESIKIEMPQTREAFLDDMMIDIEKVPTDMLIATHDDLLNQSYASSPANAIYTDKIDQELNRRVDAHADRIAQEIRGKSTSEIKRIERRWEKRNKRYDGLYNPVIQVFKLEMEAQKIEKKRN
jgi:hypothetical protein